MRELTEEVCNKAFASIRESLGEADKDYEISQRCRIENCAYFPKPPSYWKDVSFSSLYRLISPKFADYVKSWDFNGLHVVASVMIYDGQEWLHVSYSRKSKLPDYKDTQLIRRDFFGTDKKVIAVYPEEEHYVNIAEYCLHLWYSPVNPLPNFDVDIPGIGKSI